jgi:hypothetical protein
LPGHDERFTADPLSFLLPGLEGPFTLDEEHAAHEARLADIAGHVVDVDRQIEPAAFDFRRARDVRIDGALQVAQLGGNFAELVAFFGSHGRRECRS